MIETYYEKYIKDQSIIEKGIADGKFLEGTMFFDCGLPDKYDGFVKVDGVHNAVKVRGLKYLNRALHLDRVIIKPINWVIWEKAQYKFTDNIDFSETSGYIPPKKPAIQVDLSGNLENVGELPTSARDRLQSAHPNA